MNIYQLKGFTSGAMVGVNTLPFVDSHSTKEIYEHVDAGEIYCGNGCWRSPVVEGKKPTETGCFVCPCSDCEWDTSNIDLRGRHNVKR